MSAARVSRIGSPTTPFEVDFDLLIPSFRMELASLGRSPFTEKVYLLGIARYRKWLVDNGYPSVIDRRLVQAWIVGMGQEAVAAATAASRLAGLRQFSKWAAKEGEIPSDPLLGVNAPKGTDPLTPCLDDDQLKALVKACAGNQLKDRRDEALIRLLTETGLRAAEVCALELSDVDLDGGIVLVRRGKGNRARTAPFGPQTARALDRYIRVRRHHPAADSPALWLAAKKRSALTTAGLRLALGKRAEAAGVEGFHPHVLRHTFAHRWQAAQGSETGLMQVAGWRDRGMLSRYARSAAAARATDEARRLNLGDF